MSSYLTFYVIPKKEKHNCYTEQNEKLSEGKPLSLLTYSRSSEVYAAFNENLNPVYCGSEEKYTEITISDFDLVIAKLKEDADKTEETLKVDYKMLKEGGYSNDLWEDIQSLEKYHLEQKEVISEVSYLKYFFEDITRYNDFENKILINVD